MILQPFITEISMNILEKVVIHSEKRLRNG